MQLKSGDPDPPEPPTSGSSATPDEISKSQPLFIIVDFFEQRTFHSVNCSEIVVRLWAGSGHEEQFVHLRDNWKFSVLSIGDTAFVIGDWKRRDEEYGIYRNKLSCYIDDKQGFFILLPHVLIQGTRLATSQECRRKAYLTDVLSGQPLNFEMFKGTIIHELIQAVLKGTLASEVEPFLDNILARPQTQSDLYLIHESTQSVKPKLMEYVGIIKKIAGSLEHGFYNGVEQFGNEKIEYFGTLNNLPPYGCQTVNEEENIWSFQWGLKGKIDVTLKHGNKLYPLELKSGASYRGTSPKDSHVLQLSAYMLMLKEKYKERTGNIGAIYYVKDSASFQIEPRSRELSHIINLRNELSHAIAHGTLPKTAPNSKSCQYCNGISACAFLETGEKERSPIREFLATKLAYEPKQHYIDFYKKWESGLLDELDITRSAQTMIWLRPVKKRIADGRAIADLSITKNCVGQIELHASNNSAIGQSMIQVGDYVMLTRGGTPPIVGRGTIIERTENRLTLEMIEFSLEDKTADNYEIFEKQLENINDICIDKWESTSSVDICRSNLMSLFSEQSHFLGSRLKELIVDSARPHFSRMPVEIPPDPRLNEDQNTAIHTALMAQDYMLLLGMPGTGKTTALISLIQTMISQGLRVLIASFTHTAVDNICLKLIKQQIPFIRFGRSESLHKDILRYSIDNIIENADDSDSIQLVLSQCKVFATTCLGCNHPLLEGKSFDVCVIDEASQINLPTVLGPLSRSRRFILVGDHYQLSPITKYGSGPGEEQPTSLFKLLCEKHPQALVTLRTQYRMNEEILKLCNELVYGFRMRTGSPAISKARMNLPFKDVISDFEEFHRKWLQLSLASEPSIVVYNTDQVPFFERKGPSSKLNNGEAAISSAIAATLILCGLGPDKIGIISPYRAQVLFIRELISKQLLSVQNYFPHIISDIKMISERIEVHTVDKFQGRDKECIIFSAVKSNQRCSPGTHITDWQRLNVAVSRAKTKFILIGSMSTLSNSPFFDKMFKIIDTKCFYDLPNEIDQVDMKPFLAMGSIVNT